MRLILIKRRIAQAVASDRRNGLKRKIKRPRYQAGPLFCVVYFSLASVAQLSLRLRYPRPIFSRIHPELKCSFHLPHLKTAMLSSGGLLQHRSDALKYCPSKKCGRNAQGGKHDAQEDISRFIR